jgi:hypothetical protein
MDIRRWRDVAAWHWAWLFLAMGLFGALFAWSSFNLAMLFMANFRFLFTYGRLALAEGGLVQLVGLVVYGYLAVAFYLGFKACEVELVARLRARRKQAADGRHGAAGVSREFES